MTSPSMNRDTTTGTVASFRDLHMSACLDCATPLPARLIELSRQDLTFLTDRPLRPGTFVQMSLFTDVVCTSAQNRATVHWCRPHARGWQIGVFLNSPLPDRLTEHVWDGLRSTLRYDCNWKAWVLWSDTRRLDSVKILNYSLNGLRMRISESVSGNADFSLFTSSQHQRERAVLSGRLQWCRKIDDEYQVGAIIKGQTGRDLPRFFGNLDAVHTWAHSEEDRLRESIQTLRCEIELSEGFLSSSCGPVSDSRNVQSSRRPAPDIATAPEWTAFQP